MFGAPLRAERPVGLEARGVDPLAALDNPSGLDVRDELGRPVSASLIAAQMKAAQVAAAVEAAYSSRLRDASVVAAVLEMIQALRLALRGGGAGEIPQRLYALAPSLRSPRDALPVAVAASALLILPAAFAVFLALASPPTCARSPRVLRC